MNASAAITATVSRNEVPQRGCSLGKRRIACTLSSRPCSKALIVMCSAPWYWNTRATSCERPISQM